MIELGIRDCGLQPDVFWDLTLRELALIVEAKNRDRLFIWDVARTIGVWVLSPHTKKRLKPKDLLKLPSEGVRPSTFDEFQKAIERSNVKSTPTS